MKSIIKNLFCLSSPLLLACLVLSPAGSVVESAGVSGPCDGYSRFKLLAGITSYTSARKHIECEPNLASGQAFDTVTLEQKHEALVSQGCKPARFYMVGRHSARYPDEAELEKFSLDLGNLVKSMNKTDKTRKYLAWRLEIDRVQSNMITGIGAQEQQELAHRYSQVYPEFFDALGATINFGTTSAVRTAQSAVVFMQEVSNFGIDQCLSWEAPIEAWHPYYNAKQAREHHCYKEVIGRYARLELEFQKTCKREIMKIRRDQGLGGADNHQPKTSSAGATSSGQTSPYLDQIPRLKKDLWQRLSIKVATKLGLPHGSVSVDQTESSYNVCRYELVIQGNSIWCELFDDNDLAALDYLEDAGIYHKIGSRLESNKLQSCPIVKEILTELLKAKYVRQAKALFNFTHVGVLKKILATFGFFESSFGYSRHSLVKYASTQELPPASSREWRGSLMTPFSGNVAFVAYKCTGGDKILTAISERPVRVAGCSDSACPADEFFQAYGEMLECDIGRVCEEVSKGLD